MARSIPLLLATCIAALSSAPAWGGCTDTYPDSQVTQRLTKDAYTSCELETMRADYAGILKEQVRLLGLLKLAYERALLKDVNIGKPGVQKRLDEFEARLKELSGLVESISATAKAPAKAEKGKGAGDGQAANKLLQKGREVSELLRSRIAHARESLEPGEADTYCKLDFHFRLGDGLAALMRKCMK